MYHTKEHLHQDPYLQGNQKAGFSTVNSLLQTYSLDLAKNLQMQTSLFVPYFLGNGILYPKCQITFVSLSVLLKFSK